MDMQLNDTMWKHVRHRFRMWSREGLLIGDGDAFLNALAVVFWHLSVRHCRKDEFPSPGELAAALTQSGVPVTVTAEDEAYEFELDGVRCCLQVNEYFGLDATLCGVGFPENRCVCNMVHMAPERFADFMQEFRKLFPEIRRKALDIAREINAITRKFFPDAVQRAVDPDLPHPVIDEWVIEENFTWKDGKRYLVGIDANPLELK